MGANNTATTTPIAGATVIVSHTIYTGATPPPNATVTEAGGCVATTAADGSYTCSGASMTGALGANDGEFYIMAFAGSGNASLHDTVYPVNPPQDEPAGYAGPSHAVVGANAVRDLYLTPIDATTAAWVNGINSENASFNPAAGANANLVTDEALVEADVHWANYMANHNWYAHTCTGTGDPTCINDGGYYQTLMPAGQGLSSNIDHGVTAWSDFQQAVVNEQSVCTNPVSWNTCPNGDPPSGAGHLKNQLNPTNIWVGVAQAANVPAVGGGPWYVSGFVSATYNSAL